MFLSQNKYLANALETYGLQNKPAVDTPMTVNLAKEELDAQNKTETTFYARTGTLLYAMD